MAIRLDDDSHDTGDADPRQGTGAPSTRPSDAPVAGHHAPRDGDAPDDPPQETERYAPETLSDLAVDVEKRCRVCGKDVRGHRRYKDRRGYICLDCDREEKLRAIPCAECGKPTDPKALQAWGPVMICTRCYADHQTDPKLRVKKRVSTKQFDLYERQNLLVLAGVAAVLLFLMLMSLVGC